MKKLSLALFLIFLGSVAAYPAQVFKFKTIDYESKPPLVELAEIIIQDSIVRFPRLTEDGSSRKEEMVFTGNGLYLIDHPNRSYNFMDKESMRAMGSQMDEAMQKMKEMIDKLPKEQQEKITTTATKNPSPSATK